MKPAKPFVLCKTKTLIILLIIFFGSFLVQNAAQKPPAGQTISDDFTCSDLYNAMKQGADLNVIRPIIERTDLSLTYQGPTIEKTGPTQGDTFLHQAIAEKLEDVALYLIDRKLQNHNLVAKNNDHQAPLHYACRHDLVKVIQLLRKKLKAQEFNACLAVDKDGYAPIHIAAYYGHVYALQALFDGMKQAELSTHIEKETETHGITARPLHLAAKQGQVDVVEWLLKNHATIDAPTPFNLKYPGAGGKSILLLAADNTPLHIAANQGQLAVVTILCMKGASTKALNFYKINVLGEDISRCDSAIFSAARNNQANVTRWLYENGAEIKTIDISKTQSASVQLPGSDLMNKTFDDLTRKIAGFNLKRSKLFRYAYRGSVTADESQTKFQELLQQPEYKNYDLNSRNVDDETFLHMIIKSPANPNASNLIKFLKQKGVSLDLKDGYDNTPLCLAAKEGDYEAIKALFAGYKKEDIRNLLQETGESGKTPLHLAAEYGGLEALKLLLQKVGPKPHQIYYENLDLLSNLDSEGNTPLFLAVKKNRKDVVAFLLGVSAEDFYAENNLGEMLLHVAAKNGNTQIVQALIGKGVEDRSAKNGNKALHLAAKAGFLDIVKILSPKDGMAAISENELKETPVHLAAAFGHTKVVEYLLGVGAPFNLHDQNNATPLHLAARNGQPQVVNFLLTRGAEIGARTKQGKTALHAAAESGNPEVLQAMLKKLDETGDSKKKNQILNEVDTFGETALHKVLNARIDLTSENLAMAKKLITAGAKVEENDFVAVGKSGDIDAIEQLNLVIPQANSALKTAIKDLEDNLKKTVFTPQEESYSDSDSEYVDMSSEEEYEDATLPSDDPLVQRLKTTKESLQNLRDNLKVLQGSVQRLQEALN